MSDRKDVMLDDVGRESVDHLSIDDGGGAIELTAIRRELHAALERIRCLEERENYSKRGQEGRYKGDCTGDDNNQQEETLFCSARSVASRGPAQGYHEDYEDEDEHLNEVRKLAAVSIASSPLIQNDECSQHSDSSGEDRSRKGEDEEYGYGDRRAAFATVESFRPKRGNLVKSANMVSEVVTSKFADVSMLGLGKSSAFVSKRELNSKFESVQEKMGELRSLIRSSNTTATNTVTSAGKFGRLSTNSSQTSRRGLRMRMTLFGRPSYRVGARIETTLDEDTYSLMMMTRVGSRSWMLGASSFLFQMSLGAMIAYSQYFESGSSSFGVPFKVEGFSFRVAQFLTIILSLSTQSDILTSIRSFFLLGKGSNWYRVIGEEDSSRSCAIWIVRVGIPNTLKLSQGLVVTYVSFIIIVENKDIITLLKDFSSLMVISEFDNILFQLAANGYLGEEIRLETAKIAETTVTTVTDINEFTQSSAGGAEERRRKNLGTTFVQGAFLSVLSFMFIGWIAVVFMQERGFIFHREFPGCGHYQTAKHEFGDGKCFGGPFNSIECKFEDGDCANFNAAYPRCKGIGLEGLERVEEQVANKTAPCNMTFAIPQCDFDGGSCCPYNIQNSPIFGDGQCHGGEISKEGCGHDHGDCISFIDKYPECNVEDGTNETILGNGLCEGGGYTRGVCGYEFGDCDVGQLGGDIAFTGVLSLMNEISFILRMSPDGSKIFVGTPSTDIHDNYSWSAPGRVIRYEYNTNSNFRWVDSNWLELGAKRASNLNFGSSVGVNNDGSVVAVGSHGYDKYQGRVEVYTFGISDRPNSAIDGASFGAGVYSLFGWKIDLIDDGSRMVISSPYQDKPLTGDGKEGMVQVFQLSETKWVQLGQTIYGTRTNQIIGAHSLRINSMNGTRVFFSVSPSQCNLKNIYHRAYEFDKSSETWIQLGNDIESSFPGNNPLAVSEDGSRVAISSNSTHTASSGEVKVFDLKSNPASSNKTWNQLGHTIFKLLIYENGKYIVQSSAGDGFGYSISMSGDGRRLAISSVKSGCDGLNFYEFHVSEECDQRSKAELCATGSVQMYEYKSTGSSKARFALLPPKRYPNFQSATRESKQKEEGTIFGLQVELSKDGSTVAISGYNIMGKSGFAKVYTVADLFYVDCSVDYPRWIIDSTCADWEPYYTEECGYSAGLCPSPSQVDGFDDCQVAIPNTIGNTVCQDFLPYNSKQCGFDGSDCGSSSLVEGYEDCYVSDASKIGDGECYDRLPYNGPACGFDGGDCLPDSFVANFP